MGTNHFESTTRVSTLLAWNLQSPRLCLSSPPQTPNRNYTNQPGAGKRKNIANMRQKYRKNKAAESKKTQQRTNTAKPKNTHPLKNLRYVAHKTNAVQPTSSNITGDPGLATNSTAQFHVGHSALCALSLAPCSQNKPHARGNSTKSGYNLMRC